MGMQVDGAERDDTAARINFFGASCANLATDLGDPAMLDGQVCPIPGNTGPIHDCAATNHQVILRHDRIGLFGHSRGGGAVLNYSLQGGNVQAVVLNSSGYPSQLTDRSAQVKAPILMLHGTADSPDEGGSAATNVRMARAFEATLRGAGKEASGSRVLRGRPTQ